MTKLYRLTQVNPNEVVLADPDNLRNTLTIRNKTVSKVVSGHRMINVRTELVDNSQVPVTIGTDVVDDTVSVRVVLSASDRVSPELIATIWPRVKANVDAALADGVSKGFIPTTADFIVSDETNA